MTCCKTRRITAFILAVISLIMCLNIETFAASTPKKRIVEDYINGGSHTETYNIKVGWFTTSKKVTPVLVGGKGNFDGSAKKSATQPYARFDVSVTYTKNGTTYCENHYGLKAEQSFTLANKAWNQTVNYKITVKSYLTRGSSFDMNTVNYQLKY